MPPVGRVPFLRHLAPPRPGDDGALPVFEAIIAGMLILTAILFLTAIGRPAPTAGQSGIDLGENAADTLRILLNRDANDPGTYPDRLTEIVSLAMMGDTAEATEFLGEIVPLGSRYLLRLDNGLEPLTLLPQGSGPSLTPRAAQAASVFIVPTTWNANGDPVDVPDADGIAPRVVPNAGHAAKPFTLGTYPCIVSPTGSTLDPEGQSWVNHWKDDQWGGAVPADVPYGVWVAYDDAPCSTNPVFIKVTLASGTDAAYPAYGVQLVVWLAA